MGLILFSLSAPLGIESLPPTEAAPLLQAWHDGLWEQAAHAPGTVAGWLSVTEHEPDLTGLARAFREHPEVALGLQVPATWLATPSTLERHVPTLQVCLEADRPVLVHPGPSPQPPATEVSLPAWWPAVVHYPAQLQAAWWSWLQAGRAALPGLRICFAAGAGLAPLHHERFVTRSGRPFVVDPDVFVDTSSYRRQGVDGLVRALGIDTVVLGTDRPYAGPVEFHLGEAADLAITVTNPGRLLGLPNPGGAR